MLAPLPLAASHRRWNWRLIQEIYLPQGTYPHAVTAARQASTARRRAATPCAGAAGGERHA